MIQINLHSERLSYLLYRLTLIEASCSLCPYTFSADRCSPDDRRAVKPLD